MAYITVDSIVREAISDEGNTLHLYPSYLKYALRGVRELNMECITTLKSVLLPINRNNTVDIPRDYIDYTKVGLVGKSGNIRVLAVNNKICTLPEVDSCGEPVARHIASDTRHPVDAWGWRFHNLRRRGVIVSGLFGHGGGYNRNGAFRVNEGAWQFQLSSDVSCYTNHIILEYSNNGISDHGETMINEMAFEAMMAWINWKAAMPKRAVAAGEKDMLERQYLAEYYKLKHRMYSFTLEEFKAALRTNFSQAIKY